MLPNEPKSFLVQAIKKPIRNQPSTVQLSIEWKPLMKHLVRMPVSGSENLASCAISLDKSKSFMSNKREQDCSYQGEALKVLTAF